MKRLKYAVILLLGLSMTFMASCTKDPNNGGNGTYNGHEYVDLGLPSGTLWATCNIGANTPDSTGDYFAWGETREKYECFWENYKHCNRYASKLTKYCTNVENGDHGFCDNLTVLQAEDDAATANWGSGWCTPTKEQWTELLNKTTTTYATLNGVEGRLLTASNGNSIFLPPGGYCEGTRIVALKRICYWTSTLSDSNNRCTRACAFDNGCVGSYERYLGIQVRPVRSNH